MAIVSASRSQECLTHWNVKVKIYDVEKKELIKECESMQEAALFSGLKHSGNVRAHIIRKTRCYKNSLNKIICFR